MHKLLKKRSKKAGLLPGSLLHIGEQKTHDIKITIISYNETVYEKKELTSIEEYVSFFRTLSLRTEKPFISWVNVDGVHNPEVVRTLGDIFGVHPLVQEDILNTDQRPKIEDYGNYLYIVLKMLSLRSDRGNGLQAEQVSLLVFPNAVISFQEEKIGDVFDPIRDRIRNNKGLIRKEGADYLAYSLMDAVVDNYFITLENLGDKIEILENELLENPAHATLKAIYHLKREMIFLRKAVWPLRDVVSTLSREESSLIHSQTRMYLRDIHDHVIGVIDVIETFREMITEVLEIYLSGISNRLNSVMKVLTLIATIFMPLTFIASIYGMNFKHMPELEWYWGYPAVLTVMGVTGVSMLIFFKKKKWV